MDSTSVNVQAVQQSARSIHSREWSWPLPAADVEFLRKLEENLDRRGITSQPLPMVGVD